MISPDGVAVFDQERIRRAVIELLEAVGEDPNREGLVDTLARAVAREGEITDMLSLCEAAGARVSILPSR